MNLKLWKTKAVPGITFANNSYSHHTFPPHFHDHYVVMIVNEGVNEGVCEKRRYQVTTNDILFINPGEIHTGNSFRGEYLQYAALYIDADFFVRDAHGPTSPPVFTSLLQTNAELVSAIRELIRSSRLTGSQFETEESKAKVCWNLLNYTQTLRPAVPGGVSKAVVRKVKNFIQDRYKEQFSLASLTDYVGLSPFHLVRSFKEAVGMTPFQFLRNYRVERAKSQLSQKNRSISEVAVEVGFYDQPHFHKHFKLVTGVTPREFQRQQQ